MDGDARRLQAEPILERVTRLQRDRRQRDREQCHFIEGLRNVAKARDHGVRFERLITAKQLLPPTGRTLVAALRWRGVPVERVTPERFRHISALPRASGLGAIVRRHDTPIRAASADVGLCWIVLERVRSAGNLGSLLRSAAAVGAAGVVVLGPAIDLFAPDVVRASMGAIFTLRLCRSTPIEFERWADRHRVTVVGATPDGATPFQRARYPRPVALMLGDERKGLSETQRRLCDRHVAIPMVGDTDSLNLAVAGSVLLYEVLRRVG